MGIFTKYNRLKPINYEVLPLLDVPSGFRDLVEHNQLELFKIVNGCGAAGAKLDFVPDTIWFLAIYMACYIHDWEYHTGLTELDRLTADDRFLRNMLILIAFKSGNGVTASIRRIRAINIYNAVRELGGSAFRAGKNEYM
jgi:hypothetical protein